ncbi:unnamed protein product [Scytosiphon promiscuus]
MNLGWMKTLLGGANFHEARSLTTALLMCNFTRFFLIDQRTIMSRSMQPSLVFGDRILVDKASILWGKLPLRSRPSSLGLRRGDIVVFKPPDSCRPLYAELLFERGRAPADTTAIDDWRCCLIALKGVWERRVARTKSPLNPSLDFTKRVVALAGDRIAVRGGVMYLNGHEQPSARDRDQDESGRRHSTKATYSLDTSVIPENHIFVLGDNRDESFDSHVWGPLSTRNVQGRAVARYWPLNRAGWLRR